MSVTIPDPDTVATSGLEDAHATAFAATACPDWSSGAAEIWSCVPAAPDSDAGLSVMSATWGSGAR